MTLPIWTTNPYTALTTSQIEDEFGGDAPTGLGEYYRNGSSGYVTGDRVGFPNGVSTPIPLFGSPLSISNFYGASAVSYSITTNKTAYNEGETMSISVTAPAADGSTLYWTIEDVTTGISISPTSLPSGIKGGSQAEVYQQQLTASGGTGPYTFSIVVGSAPAGITLSSAGLLSGFPTSAGVTTFTVQALDSQGNGGVQQYTLSVVNVTYLPATLPNGTQGSAYSQQLSVSGGTAPYVYEVMGTLPAGLSMSSSGLLSGTPEVTGTFNTSIRVTFNGGSMGGPGITISYVDWVIGGAISISVSPSSLPTGAINTSYSQQLSASGGTAPYTYSTSSTLPTGVTLSSSGLLSGTPTQSGTYNLTIQVNDSASHSTSVQRTFSVGSVNISISPSSLPSATQNSAFSQQLSASGGTGPYTYSSTGSLPAGLSLTSGGLLAGTPTATGTTSIEIVANDANTNTGSKTYSLVVGAPTIADFYFDNGTVLTVGSPAQYNKNTVPQSVDLYSNVILDYSASGVIPYNANIDFVLSGDIDLVDILSMEYEWADNSSVTYPMTPSLTGTLVAKPYILGNTWSYVRLYITLNRAHTPYVAFRTISLQLTAYRSNGSTVTTQISETVRDDGWN